MSWVVYILKVSDGSYYTGITNDINKRMEAHKSKKGSKYVASRLPFSVVYMCQESDRSEASKKEIRIKKLSRKNKELLVTGKLNLDENEVHLFCEQCGSVMIMKREDIDWPKFEIECFICKNILEYEEEQIKEKDDDISS
jgi:putative endonuclease